MRTKVESARARFFDIMRRHFQIDDDDLTDRDLVEAVIERWRASLADYLIDPNE